ncbi:hypothetical protein COOONC_11667 [Cooperia oncophora]
MGRGEESDIRIFLNSLDITKESWKDEAERWISDRLHSSRSRRQIPRFSIGDEDCDLSDSEHPLTNDACTQTLAEENPQQENELPQKSLDEISRDWNEGRTLSAPDALRLVKRGIVKCRELESRLDAETAIFVRRSFVAPEILKELPFRNL